MTPRPPLPQNMGPDHTPGLTNYYQGCRCFGCRTAYNKMRREMNWRRKAERVLVNGNLVHPRANHGTVGGYGNWSCRCPSCRAANAEQQAVYRERYKAQGKL